MDKETLELLTMLKGEAETKVANGDPAQAREGNRDLVLSSAILGLMGGAAPSPQDVKAFVKNIVADELTVIADARDAAITFIANNRDLAINAVNQAKDAAVAAINAAKIGNNG